MSVKKSKTLYAALGMLSFGPKSAYEISQSIQRSTKHFWAESDGQLYPNLKKLAEEGLITVRQDEASGQPNKKVYEMTEAGHEALIEWLKQAPTTFNVRNEFLLQLFFGHNLNDQENAEKIKDYRYEMKQLLKLFDQTAVQVREKSEYPKYLLLTLKYAEVCLKAEMAWCDEAIELLTQHEG